MDYRIIRRIGTGSSSKVYLAELKRKLVCIKVIPLNETGRAQRELEIIKRLPAHENILKTFSVLVNDATTLVYLILEYASGGDLDQYLKTIKQINLTRALTWFCHLGDGVSHLHSHGILHRDIKTRNILLCQVNGEMVLKLADFGIAKPIQDSLAHTCIGTPMFLSPELCQGKAYSYPSDIWSLGCCFYSLLALKHPFPGDCFAVLVDSILKGKMEPWVADPSLVSLIVQMLHADPGKRPPAKSLRERIKTCARTLFQTLEETRFQLENRYRDAFLVHYKAAKKGTTSQPADISQFVWDETKLYSLVLT